VNRVVITQVDDCCIQNNLRSARVVLNGQPVTSACGKFVRATSCGPPPAVVDAFPIFDNELDGPDRVDSVLVVFDRPVEQTSAENVEHYALGSEAVIAGAHRLDAPEDDRVVLEIHGGLTDGAVEEITVSGVRSLDNDRPLPAPVTLKFRNGVLELDDIDAPDPDALVNDGCVDRSRFSDGER